MLTLTCPSKMLKSKQISNRAMRRTFSLAHFAPCPDSGGNACNSSCVEVLLLKERSLPKPENDVDKHVGQ